MRLSTSRPAVAGWTPSAWRGVARHPLATALQIALLSGSASAADIQAQLAPGDGFEINSQTGNVMRLRVNDDGSVLIPALPGSTGEEQSLETSSLWIGNILSACSPRRWKCSNSTVSPS